MMQRILLALVLLVPMSATAQANTLKAHGGPTQTQVESLPADAANWYVSVMGDPSDPEFRKVTAWFQTNPELMKLARRTHYSAMTTNSRLYRARYAKTVPTLPCIRVQSPDGKVLCQLSGDNIPLTSAACYRAIRHHCLRCQPAPQPNIHYHIHKQEPQPKTPRPEPKTPFEDSIDNSIIKSDEPAVEEPSWEPPIWLLILLGLSALGAGVGLEWRKSTVA